MFGTDTGPCSPRQHSAHSRCVRADGDVGIEDLILLLFVGKADDYKGGFRQTNGYISRMYYTFQASKVAFTNLLQ